MTTRIKKVLRDRKFLLSIAVTLVVVGLGTWLWVNLNNNTQTKTAETAETAEIVTFSTDQPSEEEPDDSYQWDGKPDDPKYIRLPTIDNEGYIQNVGVDQNNEIAVPDNVHKAGWFINSALPGERGLSIIDGHVDGPTSRNGIFRNLEYINVGDQFEIEMGDGRIFTYVVIEVASIHEDQAASVLFSQKPRVSSQVNLITCGGLFDKESRRYDERVIVAAELVS